MVRFQRRVGTNLQSLRAVPAGARSGGRWRVPSPWKFSDSCPMTWRCCRQGCCGEWEVKLDQVLFFLLSVFLGNCFFKWQLRESPVNKVCFSLVDLGIRTRLPPLGTVGISFFVSFFNIYLAMLGLSGSTWDLQSSLWQGGYLVAARRIFSCIM